MYPTYSFPPHLVTGLLRDLLLLRRRSFRADSLACIRGLQPPLQVSGTQYIPQAGPRVVTFNHYHRQGFNALWMAVAIASSIPVEMHFAMTGELTFPGKWYAPLGRFISRLILHRAARTYAFTSMPPMPPREKDVQARAASVRQVLEVARYRRDALIGLAPEGSDQPGGRLSMPAPGAGRFCLLLHGLGYRFVPAGVYEEEGALYLAFGPEYSLDLPPGLSPDAKDAAASRQVMSHIAPLLPESLRGVFA